MSRQLAHLLDVSACIGCRACLVACAETNFRELLEDEDSLLENDLPSNLRALSLELPSGPRLVLSQCRQCADAPCVKACPFGGTYTDPETGLVKIDARRCVGCGYCITACPFGARKMHPLRHRPVKCLGQGCEERLRAGLEPACVAACPVSARSFGDVRNPDSPIARRLARAALIRAEPGFCLVRSRER